MNKLNFHSDSQCGVLYLIVDVFLSVFFFSFPSLPHWFSLKCISQVGLNSHSCSYNWVTYIYKYCSKIWRNYTVCLYSMFLFSVRAVFCLCLPIAIYLNILGYHLMGEGAKAILSITPILPFPVCICHCW